MAVKLTVAAIAPSAGQAWRSEELKVEGEIMRCKQVRQHKPRSEKQVYEVWSNQVRRNRPNLIDKVKSEKLSQMPDYSAENACWGVAQPC